MDPFVPAGRGTLIRRIGMLYGPSVGLLLLLRSLALAQEADRVEWGARGGSIGSNMTER